MFNKKRDDINRQREDEINDLYASANLCLANEDFKQYRKRYIAMREQLIEAMIDCTAPSLELFALQMNSYQEQIKTLGLLLGSVTDDARSSIVDPAKPDSNRPGQGPKQTSKGDRI